MPESDLRARLEAQLRERILILDGAMGTMLQAEELEEADFRGDRLRDHPSDLKGNNELLVLTRPEVVEKVHHAYCAAGADIFETNTFGSTRIAQADYGTEDLVPGAGRSAPAYRRGPRCRATPTWSPGRAPGA